LVEKKLATLPHVRLPDSLHASIVLISAREDRSIGWVVREALEAWVREYMTANLSRLESDFDHFRGAHRASSFGGVDE
jgi:hypothetical protein